MNKIMGNLPHLNIQTETMTKRIRLILISVFVTIICIILLQAYWINNSYCINRDQLLKELNFALEESVKLEINERYRNQSQAVYHEHLISVGSFPRDSTTVHKLDSLFNNIQQDTSFNTNFSFNLEATQNPNNQLESDSIPDRIEIRIKDLLYSVLQQELDDGFTINTLKIDSIFTQKLSERNLSLKHYIEVVNKNKDSLLFTSAQVGSDTLMSILSRSVNASITGKQFVRVRIPNVQQVILIQMTWAISASLLLMFLVLACFLYMLITIFKQKELSQIKNDFINNMTHELKTPIATVSAAVEAMQNFGVLDDKDKTVNYLRVSAKELIRLSNLVEKVLTMAKEEHEPIQMNVENLDVKKLCNTIIQSREMITKDKRLTIQFQSFSNDCWVKADRFHLSNVIENLIENSMKYSGNEVDIKIECKKKGPFFVISVSDNGIGIPNKYQTKIFDQFYRVPTGNQHNIKGFGLGLHYVKSIIQKHGGTVSVISTLHKGSKFTINLPSEL